MNAIEHLKTMSVAAVAAKLGIGESTVYSWKSDEKKLKDAAAVGKAGAKSTKGGEFPKVRSGQFIFYFCESRVCFLFFLFKSQVKENMCICCCSVFKSQVRNMCTRTCMFLLLYHVMYGLQHVSFSYAHTFLVHVYYVVVRCEKDMLVCYVLL